MRICRSTSSVSVFLRAGEDKGLGHFCVSVPGVWCTVRLFQLSRKKSLGNRNRHRRGSLSGKWNPESGSQTSNHTFVLFIHPAQAESPGGGKQKRIQECVFGNQRVKREPNWLEKYNMGLLVFVLAPAGISKFICNLTYGQICECVGVGTQTHSLFCLFLLSSQRSDWLARINLHTHLTGRLWFRASKSALVL